MKRKLIDLISSFLIFVGLLVIIGTVGSYDLYLISDFEFYIQAGIGLIVTIIGAISIKKGGKYYA